MPSETNLFRTEFEHTSDPRVFTRRLFLPGRAEPLEAPAELEVQLLAHHREAGRSHLYQLPSSALERIGQALLVQILGDEGLERFKELRGRGESVHIELRELPGSHAPASLPWELLHDGTDFLATTSRIRFVRTSQFVRTSPKSDEAETLRVQDPLRVLLVWAQPIDSGSLEIEKEQLRLALALAPSTQSGRIASHEVLHATRDRLAGALRGSQYDLIYFTGHGYCESGVGGVILEGPEQRRDPLTASEFESLLALQRSPPALLVLNCCLSGGVDQNGTGPFLDAGRWALQRGIPHVVATLTPVFVGSSRAFAEQFLASLLRDDCFDVGRAVQEGRAAVARLGRAALAQSFYQYLHLARRPRPMPVDIERISAPDLRSRVYFCSDNRPAANVGVLTRNELLVELEESIRAGHRVLGLRGMGGLGKTVLTTQLEARLLTHPDPQVAVEEAVWIDLRGVETATALLEQLTSIAALREDRLLVERLASQLLKLTPMVVVKALSESFPKRVLLTIDNCEPLLDEQGRIANADLRSLLFNLAAHTGWIVVFTSRESFSFRDGGRDPCPVAWFPVGELSLSARAALFEHLREGYSRVIGEWTEEATLEVLRKVAGHPYELQLFLRDPMTTAQVEERIVAVHADTAEYARLDYYLGRCDPLELGLLRILARIDRALPFDFLAALATRTFHRHPESGTHAEYQKRVQALTDRGLVLESDEGFAYVLPVLSFSLETSGGRYSSTPSLRRDLSSKLCGHLLDFSLVARERSDLPSGQDGAREMLQRDAWVSALGTLALQLALECGRIDVGWQAAQLVLTASVNRARPAIRVEVIERLRALVGEGASAEPTVDLAVAHGVLGSAYTNLRDWPRAVEHLERSIQTAEAASATQTLSTTHHQIGMVWQMQREWQKALDAYQKAIEWSERTDQLHQIGSSHHQIGTVWQRQREWQKALDAYQKAIEWFERTGQLHGLGSSHHQIGMVWKEQRDWQKALDACQKAIEWFERTGQLHEVGGSHHLIGMIREEQSEWKKALDAYQEAIEWKERTGQLHELGGSHHQIGTVWREQREWQKAFDAYQKAIEWSERTGQLHEVGSSHLLIGRVWEEQREWQKALDAYLKAIEWSERTGEAHGMSLTLFLLSRVLVELDEPTKALAALEKALDRIDQFGPEELREHITDLAEKLRSV